PLDIPLHAHIGILAQRRRGLLRQTHKEAIETRHLPVGRRLAGSYQSLRHRTQRRTETLHMDCRSRQNYPSRQTRAPSVRIHPLVAALVSGFNRRCLAVASSGQLVLKLHPLIGCHGWSFTRRRTKICGQIGVLFRWLRSLSAHIRQAEHQYCRRSELLYLLTDTTDTHAKASPEEVTSVTRLIASGANTAPDAHLDGR